MMHCFGVARVLLTDAIRFVALWGSPQRTRHLVSAGEHSSAQHCRLIYQTKRSTAHCTPTAVLERIVREGIWL